MYFATLADIEPILKMMEDSFQLQYFKTGLFDESGIVHYNSIFEKMDIGFTDKANWMSDDNFLVIPRNLILNVRDVPQKKGGIKYAVDQSTNMKSICIQLGGIYVKKDKVLVAGKLSTIAEESTSLELYGFFSKKIKKAFRKIEEFNVGKEAEEKLHSGWRLVLDERRKEEYDLKI